MSGQGTAVVNFGAFPGSTDTSVLVSASTIGSTSLVEAWISISPSSDHSADEHMIERIKVFAGNVVAGTGFTIYALDDNQLLETDALQFKGGQPLGGSPKVYGSWNVNWVWN